MDNTHTTVLLLVWDMSGTTRVSRYQKGKTKKVKTNLDLLEQKYGQYINRINRINIKWGVQNCTLLQNQSWH